MKRLTSVLAIITGLLAAVTVQATPFASCISNINNTIYFNLNEPGGNVTVTYEDGSTNANFNGKTTGLNLPIGYQNFSLVGHTSYAISVFKAGTGVPTNIVTIARGSARGIAANINATSKYFGYVYSVIGGAGAVVMRSDGSGGAAGNPFPGSTLKPPGPGVTWGTGASSQYSISVAPDDYVLISDYQSTSEGGLIRVDPTFNSSQLLLNGITGLSSPANVGAGQNHGTAESRAILTAPIGQNPTLYVVDGTGYSSYNQILKYNLGTANYDDASLPWGNQPDAILAQVNPASVQGLNGTLRSGLSIGTNGYFYVSVDRANLSNPNLQVYAPDGTTLLWSSFWTNSSNARQDFTVTGTQQLAETGAGPAESALSPDGRYIALVHDDNHITIFTVTNGIPDISSEYLIFPTAVTTIFGRGICWDAADNLWMASSGAGQVYEISVGRTATAITTGNAAGTTGFQVLSPTEVDIAPTQPVAAQANSYGFPTTATSTVTRTGDISSPLDVSFTTTGGTAPNGTYIVSATNTVHFNPGQSQTNINITAVTDGIARPTTTVITRITDNGSGQYIVGFQNQATTFIINEATPQLVLSTAAGTMYKAYSNDYTSISITRWGDTNSSFTTSAFAYGGTAVRNTDFASISTTVSFTPGQVTKTVNVAKPLINGQPPVDTTPASYTGPKTISVSIPSGTGYTSFPSNGVANVTILDNAYPAATVLYSNPLTDPNDAANWVITSLCGDTTAPVDYNVDFGYDLTVNNPNAGFNGTVPLPPSGATTALRVTCNKNNGSQACAVNLYPNVTFSGNYAVRFNMYIMEGSVLPLAAEGPLFGIGHDGLETNWWYSSGPITAGASWTSDGVWYWLGAMPGGYTSDYMEFTGISNNIPNSGWRRPATSTFSPFANVFKVPQDFSAVNSATNNTSGLPANASPFLLPSAVGNWSDVEIKQSNNVVTLTINKTQIFSMANTNTLFQSGHPMLGYEVPNAEYAGSEAAVYFSDLKVVSLAAVQTASVQITSVQVSGGNSVINFTSTITADPASQFTLRSSSTVNGAFSDTAAPVTGSGGTYQATIPLSGSMQYYRIRRN